MVAGGCADWIPRAAGGGFLVTAADQYRRATITSIDRDGRAGARLVLTSQHWAHVNGGTEAADGGVFLAVTLREDLTHASARGPRRLAFGRYFLGAVLRLPASLDEVSWTRVFTAKETGVAALLPGTRGGVDAVVNFRGTLHATGTRLSGSGTYGWGTARVALSEDGRPVDQRDWTLEPGFATTAVAAIDGGAVALTPAAAQPSRGNITRIASSGARDSRVAVAVTAARFDTADGRAWLLECDCVLKDGRLVGAWDARELGEKEHRIPLRGTLGDGELQWTSIITRGTRVAATGTATDARTGTPVTFSVLASIDPAAPELDLASLAHVDRLALASGCGRPRTRLADRISAARTREQTALSACGAERMRAEVIVWPDGGIRSFVVQDQKGDPIDPAVTACVRRVFEPSLACPLDGDNLSFPLNH